MVGEATGAKTRVGGLAGIGKLMTTRGGCWVRESVLKQAEESEFTEVSPPCQRPNSMKHASEKQAGRYTA